MTDCSVTLTKDVEIDVKGEVVSKLSDEAKKDLIFEMFDVLQPSDKAEILSDMFAKSEDEPQKEALDTIISSKLSDEQFHVLTEYFKKYGR